MVWLWCLIVLVGIPYFIGSIWSILKLGRKMPLYLKVGMCASGIALIYMIIKAIIG